MGRSTANNSKHDPMPRKQVAKDLTFTVVLEPDGSGWHAHIPSVQGCRTWGRSLTEARRNVREALSTCEDVFPDAEAVAKRAVFVEDVRLPGATRKKLSAYTVAREEADVKAERARVAAERAAVSLIREAGVSLRDAGELLGLSRERVRQLAGDPAA